MTSIVYPAAITEERERRLYAACPACNEPKAHRFDHLLPTTSREFGPWYCDKCGVGVTGMITGEYVSLTRALESAGKRRVQTLAVLRVKDTDIMAVVKSGRYEPDPSDRDRDESNRYFYEEHTCSTNISKDILMFYAWGETDPHGVFEYVGEVDATPEMIEAVDKCDPPETIKKLLSTQRTGDE